MAEDIQIKLVQVEFLRGGPPHNQLLSPLTSYLAISGNAGAGIIRVPYEHAEFERRLKELRYETGDPSDRQGMLHSTGTEMGKILGAVPGVPGALESTRGETLVHLRITLSASELAFLPFEVAKVPVSDAVTGENWLSLQTRPPVCITRNIRTVSPEGVTWPDRPRILFIVGDKESTPYEEHRMVLLQAIEPFRYPKRGELSLWQDETLKDESRQQVEDLLTILVNPTLSEVREECSKNPYTHVHVLAHGDVNDVSRNSYGLVLQADKDSANVVSGEQFALALTSVQSTGIHRPTVVTLASCDSANVGTVVVPGASFAHALHQSGIPLVVASQFPLSKEGSIPLAKTLYEGLLWGENPLVLLHEVRAQLHTGAAFWHDWASLVVYEALPQKWAEQLDTLRYAQSRRAMNAALERIDLAVQSVIDHVSSKDSERLVLKKEQSDSLEKLTEVLQRALNRLPLNGQYGIECLGLRASSYKRRAEAVFQLPTDESSKNTPRDPCELLEKALQDYEQGARGLLVNDARGVQRIATLHWLLVQVVSLSAVLGRRIDESQWHAAKLSADLYGESLIALDRAWAHGSLAELWLVRLALPNLTKEQKQDFSQEALKHARSLSRFFPWNDEFPIKSTRRQLERYVKWWGAIEFEKFRSKGAWEGELGLIETVKQMVQVLHRKSLSLPPGPDPRATGDPGSFPPSSPPESGGSGKLAGSNATNGRHSTKGRAAARKTEPIPEKNRVGDFFEIEMLPAGHGDALWIEYGDADSTHRLLIDCGTQQTAKVLAPRIEGIAEHERFFELFVMSHIDSDHIGGALPFLKTIHKGVRFGDVWFNGWRHISSQLGARQGEIFSTAIEGLELPWNRRFDGGPVVVKDDELPEIKLPGGMMLTLLSPTPAQLKKLAPAWTREMKRYGLEPGSRVDYSRFLKGTPSTSTDVGELADTPFAGDVGLPNGSSIAMLAEYRGAAILLGADAHAPVLADSIQKLLKQRNAGEKLKLTAFKVSHHASQNNLSSDLLKLLDCPRYLISTNGDHFCHPDRQAIARIIKYSSTQPAIYFNYRSAFNSVWERPNLQEEYHYVTQYPEGDRAGMNMSLLIQSSPCVGPKKKAAG